MKFFKYFFIFSIFIESTFGGSQSHCNTLSNDFITLNQKCEGIVDETVSFIKYVSTASPILANGLSKSLNCKLDSMLIFFSNGSSRLTGTQSNIIESILLDQLTPPFPVPLDCLQEFLISFKNKLQNAKNTEIVTGSANGGSLSSAATTSSSCLDLQQGIMPYYEQLTNVIGPKVLEFSGNADAFASINMLDLYENYINSQVSCDIESVAVGIADIVDGDQNEAIAYVNGSSSQLSEPLNCVRTIIDISSNALTSSYSEVVTKLQKVQESLTSSSSCGSFYDDMAILRAGVIKMFERIQNYTLFNSFAGPTLIQGLISESNCKILNILDIISRTLSISLNIEPFKIMNILLGFSNTPFETPLNCIGADLILIKSKAQFLMSEFAISLNNSFVASSASDTSTCEELRAITTANNVTIYNFINDAVDETNAEAQTFESFGMLVHFMENIRNIQYCETNGLSLMFSNLLNGDYEKSFNVVNGTAPAEHPYTCVEDIMVDAANYTNQLYENLIANYSANLPSFP